VLTIKQCRASFRTAKAAGDLTRTTWRQFRRPQICSPYPANVAHKAPDPEIWLELDESARIDLVRDYYRRTRAPVGQNAKVHAMAHVNVENQIAMGDVTVVPATLNRLMREGLDRHDAIHAVASILMGIFDVMTEKDNGGDINAKNGRELATLTAASWR
jgi:hypothetical protein